MGGMKSGVSLVNRSREPIGNCLVETRKTLTGDEYLAEVFASEVLPNK